MLNIIYSLIRKYVKESDSYVIYWLYKIDSRQLVLMSAVSVIVVKLKSGKVTSQLTDTLEKRDLACRDNRVKICVSSLSVARKEKQIEIRKTES